MKRALVAICLTLFGCVLSSPAHAQSPSVQSADEAEIRAAIQTQSDAWNRADIPAFIKPTKTRPTPPSSGRSYARATSPSCSDISRATPRASRWEL